MEAVGLGIGVVGLAGLFSACIDCFELVQRGRYHGKDYLLLETKFANQRLRLITWGRACGFQNDDQAYNDQIDDEIRASLETTLVQLITLLNDGRQLRSKYGLKHDQPSQNLLAAGSASIGALIPANFPSKTKLGQRLQDLKDSVYRTQKNTKLTSKVRWAIEDKAKFSELVQHLKDLIDDLEDLTRWPSISERQRHIIRCEVESISDLSVLETMEVARSGRIDAISDAASVRLWDLRDRFLEDTPEDSSTIPNQSTAASVHSIEPDWDEMTYDAQTHPNSTAGTCYQVLHRVTCPHEPTSVFLDAPSYNTKNGNDDQWVLLNDDHPTSDAKAIHMSGRRPVLDIESYLRQNQQLSFVVFRNYSCYHDGATGKEDEPQGYEQSIYLWSGKLCFELLEIFKVFLKPAQLPEFQPKSELRAPYFWFYHSKEHIDLNNKDDRGPAVQALLEIVSKAMAQEYSYVDAMMNQKTISWKYLPYLFIPEELVVETDGENEHHYQVHKLITSELQSNQGGRSQFFILHVQSWEYDGTLRSIESHLRIARTKFGPSDDAPKYLSTLPIIPLAKSGYGVRDDLVRRGRIFWKNYRQIRSYSGTVLDSDDLFTGRRFIIDPDLYHQLKQADKHSDHIRVRADLGEVAISPAVIATNDFLLRLPHTTWGYDLEEHRWRKLFVSGIANVTWAKDSFKELVLPQDVKDLLAAMVTSPRYWAGDSGTSTKRPGQFLLLHGAPGTGKSLAAEALAELAERPLYRISGSNIGTDATQIEQHFRSISHMCNKWDCVVLFDDADVFLESRSMQDLQRNAVFLTFLRCLDFFSGMVILTTTRVGTFDEAILSRCQLVVRFQPLNDESRLVIWRNLVQKANEQMDSDQLADLMDYIMEASTEMKLNGLEIRNLVTMATQLAHSQHEGLAQRHLRIVIRKSRDFSQYLHSLHSLDNEELAYKHGAR